MLCGETRELVSVVEFPGPRKNESNAHASPTPESVSTLRNSLQRETSLFLSKNRPAEKQTHELDSSLTTALVGKDAKV